jgi:hypothetical protein
MTQAIRKKLRMMIKQERTKTYYPKEPTKPNPLATRNLPHLKSLTNHKFCPI